MKAYLIDPENQQVSEVEYNGDYRQIYQHIGADCFDVVRLENEDVVYIDDEGLLKAQQFWFILQGYPQPIAGKGLVLGGDEEGDTVAPRIGIEELRSMVSFTTTEELGDRKPEPGFTFITF